MKLFPKRRRKKRRIYIYIYVSDFPFASSSIVLLFTVLFCNLSKINIPPWQEILFNFSTRSWILSSVSKFRKKTRLLFKQNVKPRRIPPFHFNYPAHIYSIQFFRSFNYFSVIQFDALSKTSHRIHLRIQKVGRLRCSKTSMAQSYKLLLDIHGSSADASYYDVEMVNKVGRSNRVKKLRRETKRLHEENCKRFAYLHTLPRGWNIPLRRRRT